MNRERPEWVSGLDDPEEHSERMMTRCIVVVWIIFLAAVAGAALSEAAHKDREAMVYFGQFHNQPPVRAGKGG